MKGSIQNKKKFRVSSVPFRDLESELDKELKNKISRK